MVPDMSVYCVLSSRSVNNDMLANGLSGTDRSQCVRSTQTDLLIALGAFSLGTIDY